MWAMLSVPSLALTEAIDCIIKAFQNPVWAEMARNRLAQIKLHLQQLQHVSTLGTLDPRPAMRGGLQ